MAQTLLQQSHLSPLPLELQPVYWQVRRPQPVLNMIIAADMMSQCNRVPVSVL